MINQYPQVLQSTVSGSATPIDSYIIGPQAGPLSISDGTTVYLKTGVVALAATYPKASTIKSAYYTGYTDIAGYAWAWMASNPLSTAVVGISGANFVYSNDNGLTATGAGDASNGSNWSTPSRIVWSTLFSRYMAFGYHGRWYSDTGTSWTMAGTHISQPNVSALLQYAEGNGKGVFVSPGSSSGPTAWVTSNGMAWTEVTTPTNFSDVTFHIPTNSFYAIGIVTGYIYRSTDGGTTWVLFNNIANFGNWIISSGTNIMCYAGAAVRVSTDNGTSFGPALTINRGVVVPAQGNTVAYKVVVNGVAVIYTYAGDMLCLSPVPQQVSSFTVGQPLFSVCVPCFTSTGGVLATSPGPRIYTLAAPVDLVDNLRRIDGTTGAYNYTTLYQRVA